MPLTDSQRRTPHRRADRSSPVTCLQRSFLRGRQDELEEWWSLGVVQATLSSHHGQALVRASKTPFPLAERLLLDVVLSPKIASSLVSEGAHPLGSTVSRTTPFSRLLIRLLQMSRPEGQHRQECLDLLRAWAGHAAPQFAKDRALLELLRQVARVSNSDGAIPPAVEAELRPIRDALIQEGAALCRPSEPVSEEVKLFLSQMARQVEHPGAKGTSTIHSWLADVFRTQKPDVPGRMLQWCQDRVLSLPNAEELLLAMVARGADPWVEQDDGPPFLLPQSLLLSKGPLRENAAALSCMEKLVELGSRSSTCWPAVHKWQTWVLSSCSFIEKVIKPTPVSYWPHEVEHGTAGRWVSLILRMNPGRDWTDDASEDVLRGVVSRCAGGDFPEDEKPAHVVRILSAIRDHLGPCLLARIMDIEGSEFDLSDMGPTVFQACRIPEGQALVEQLSQRGLPARKIAHMRWKGATYGAPTPEEAKEVVAQAITVHDIKELWTGAIFASSETLIHALAAHDPPGHHALKTWVFSQSSPGDRFTTLKALAANTPVLDKEWFSTAASECIRSNCVDGLDWLLTHPALPGVAPVEVDVPGLSPRNIVDPLIARWESRMMELALAAQQPRHSAPRPRM